MQITGTSTFDQRDVTLDIEGGPVVTKAYGKRKFLVEKLVIHYSRADGGTWRWGSTNVQGRYVLKGGSLGEGTGDSYWDRQELADLDLWSFAETHTPEVTS